MVILSSTSSREDFGLFRKLLLSFSAISDVNSSWGGPAPAKGNGLSEDVVVTMWTQLSLIFRRLAGPSPILSVSFSWNWTLARRSLKSELG